MQRLKKSKNKHLIYTSEPVDFNDKVVNDILGSSRANNSENDITGALIFRLDLYLQFLEGPEEKLDEVYKKIKLDNRHTNIHKLKEDFTERRIFSTWAMRGDPVRTWMWSHQDIKNGILTKLSPNDSFKVFDRISREIDQFN